MISDKALYELKRKERIFVARRLDADRKKIMM
jgi:hypothetical protein